MSYFNPKIYNSKNLKKEDRFAILICDDIVKGLLQNAKYEAELTLKPEMTGEKVNTLEKISAEERLDLIQELWESYEADRLNTIVGMIDSYEDFELTDEEIKAGVPDDLGEL